MLMFSYCLVATAGVPSRWQRASGGGDSLCLSSVCPCRRLGQAWARALGSGPKDSCAYRAAEAAEAAGGPCSGRYFGPVLPSPAPVSLGSLAGGTLEFYFWALPFLLLLCFLPSLSQGWEKRPHWLLLVDCRLMAHRPRREPQGLAPNSLSSQLLGGRGIFCYAQVPRTGLQAQAPRC